MFMLNYYSWWVDGWVGEKKTKLMLYSTLVEIEVEVGVELGNVSSVVYRKLKILYDISDTIYCTLKVEYDIFSV